MESTEHRIWHQLCDSLPSPYPPMAFLPGQGLRQKGQLGIALKKDLFPAGEGGLPVTPEETPGSPLYPPNWISLSESVYPSLMPTTSPIKINVSRKNVVPYAAFSASCIQLHAPCGLQSREIHAHLSLIC